MIFFFIYLRVGNRLETSQTIKANLEVHRFKEFEIVFEPEPGRTKDEMDIRAEELMKEYNIRLEGDHQKKIYVEKKKMYT